MPDPILMGPFPPPAGGVATFFTRLTTLLSERGYAYRLKRMGGQTDPIGHTWSSWWQHLRDVERGAVLLDNGTNFIESPSRRPMLQWIAWKSWRRFYWVKVLHSGNLMEKYDTYNPQQRLLIHANLRLADAIICVDSQLTYWLKEALHLIQPLYTIPSLLPLPESTILSQVTLPSADFRICTIGIFTEDYGFADSVLAVERLRQQTQRNIQLVIVDGMVKTDDNYKQVLLAGRDWIIVQQMLPTEGVYSILRQSDVVVRSTRYESYGISRIEALWNGVPIVCTPFGETRGMMVYTPGDIDSLIQHLEHTLNHPESQKVQAWARFYHTAAEQNLSDYTAILYGRHNAH